MTYNKAVLTGLFKTAHTQNAQNGTFDTSLSVQKRASLKYPQFAVSLTK